MKRTAKSPAPRTRVLARNEEAPHWATAIVVTYMTSGAETHVAHEKIEGFDGAKAAAALIAGRPWEPNTFEWVGVYALGPGAYGKRRIVTMFASDAVCIFSMSSPTGADKHCSVPDGYGVTAAGIDYEAAYAEAREAFRKACRSALTSVVAKVERGELDAGTARKRIDKLWTKPINAIIACGRDAAEGERFGTMLDVEISRLHHLLSLAIEYRESAKRKARDEQIAALRAAERAYQASLPR